jgi:DNA-binding transcriptional LysR family regulator
VTAEAVQLTPEGEAFLAAAKIVVRDADHALAVVRVLAEAPWAT